MIEKKVYSGLDLRDSEILRYAGTDKSDREALDLANKCKEELLFDYTVTVAYKIFPINVVGSVCDFHDFSFESYDLARLLEKSSRALVFGATAGHTLDRFITKYSRVSPARALMFQAIGTELVERGTDAFLSDISLEKGFDFTPRFSAGYGDLPLACQKEIFTHLDLTKHNGMYLNESLIMSPSKSVTAIAGIKNKV